MKQRIFLLIFLVLALAVSLLVYHGAQRRQTWDMQQRYRSPVVEAPFSTPAQKRVDPAVPPPSSPAMPERSLQRTLETLDEVRRINRMNAEIQRREEKKREPSSQKP